MALVLKTALKGHAAIRTGAAILEDAIQDFERTLPDEERQKLQQIKAVPDVDAVMTFTAQLDAANRSRRGRSIASRLYSVLESVRDFTAVIDTLVSARPEIAALVWGSMKLTMLLVANYTSYFEDISNLFLVFKAHCPRFDEYQVLYPTSKRLQDALCRFHASIIRCCTHAVQAIERPWQKQVITSLRLSFQKEFAPDQREIELRGEEVRQEIRLAKAQADHQHQELRLKQSATADNGRANILHQSLNNFNKIEELLVVQNQLRLRQEKQELMEALSTYDYKKLYREACQKRHYDTAEWIFSTDEFRRWNSEIGSSVLWCAGKIGSGKTVITASAIEHIARTKESNHQITYFFLRFDDAQALKTEIIIRSIIRQTLDISTLSDKMTARLKQIEKSIASTLIYWVDLLKDIIKGSERFYLYLDALDECDPAERRVLLSHLSFLSASLPNLKLFLAGRESLSVELRKNFPRMKQISMKSYGQESDIQLFVEQILQKRQEYGELVVEDPLLLDEIKCVLSQHANGMFIWVTYLIDEVCAQCCDEDIRQSLADLPRDLKETFNRVLLRITARKNSSIAQRILPWVAVVKRSLTVDELGEAVSLEAGQLSSNPDRRLKGSDRIITWCENLIELDEEYRTIQFAHRTIYDFITGPPSLPEFSQFHVDIPEADHHVGELCISYFQFSDFQTTLAHRPAQGIKITPEAIASTVVGNSKSTSLSKLAQQAVRRKVGGHNSKVSYDTESLRTYVRAADGNGAAEAAYPFLKYAAEHWIFHTTSFQKDKSSTWGLWCSIITDGHALAQTPWTNWECKISQNQALDWACFHGHHALISFAHRSDRVRTAHKNLYIQRLAQFRDVKGLRILMGGKLSSTALSIGIEASASAGHLDIIRILATRTKNVDTWSELTERTALQAASAGGHIQVIEYLLRHGGDVTHVAGRNGGLTAVQAACKGGHLDVLLRLLDMGGSVNEAAAMGNGGRTALQAASENGHANIVKCLLDAGASINNPNEVPTSLTLASKGGYLEVVHELIAAGASANIQPSETAPTPLQAAAEQGHIEVLNFLLSSDADPCTEPAPKSGRSALQAACQNGYGTIVERLLEYQTGRLVRYAAMEAVSTDLASCSEDKEDKAIYVDTKNLDLKAMINEPATRVEGRTALQAASEGGHLSLVRRLLVLGADVNADPSEIEGRTALQAASAGGHREAVNALIAANANVTANVGGHTALQLASQAGHLDIVKQLLKAGADVNGVSSNVEVVGRTALEAASDGGHLEVVDYLLSRGATVSRFAESESYSALKYAAEGGNLGIVQLLLTWKPREITREEQRLALSAACECGHFEIVQYLVASGMEVNRTGDQLFYRRSTPLQAASKGGNLQIVELLLENGAEVNAAAATDEGYSALQAACGEGHIKIANRLLDSKADIHATAGSYSVVGDGYEGRYGTALAAAARGGHLEVVERLLEAGASLLTSDPLGGVPVLLLAVESGDLEVVKRLLQAGAYVNAYSSSGRTPLLVACQADHLQMVELLLSHHADPTATPDKDGNTILGVAETCQNPDIWKRVDRARSRHEKRLQREVHK